MATKRYEFKIVHASFHTEDTVKDLNAVGDNGFYFVAYLGNDDILLQRDLEPRRNLASFETEDGHKIYFETTESATLDAASAPGEG